VAKQFSAPVDSFSGGFGANKFQGAFNKTVLPECLVNKRLPIASPMKDLKIKEEVLIWPEQQVLQVLL
jgi:hypothetical protein